MEEKALENLCPLPGLADLIGVGQLLFSWPSVGKNELSRFDSLENFILGNKGKAVGVDVERMS